MSENNFTIYYSEREQRERHLASAAPNPVVAAIHLELARRYAQLAAQGEQAIHA